MSSYFRGQDISTVSIILKVSVINLLVKSCLKFRQ